MEQVNSEQDAIDADKQKFRDLLERMPLIERGKLLAEEMLRILQERPLTNELPEYCYNIMKVLRKTHFEAFPSLRDVVAITDETAAREAKTLEAAKGAMHLDWRKLGRVLGIAGRCVQHFDLEAGAETSEFKKCSTEETSKIVALVFGKHWVENNGVEISEKTLDVVLDEQVAGRLGPFVERHAESAPPLAVLAYQWGPKALAELHKGMAEGMTGFLNEHGSFTRESVRAGTYFFLLIIWPEIKEMLESEPRKNLTDLHEWLKPFMRMGFLPNMDLESFRDLCGPPPGGIDLRMRPLKARRSKPSA